MLTIVFSLLPVFAVIILGFGLRKSGILPKEQWHGIEQISFWLLFPALLITTLARSELSFGALAPYAMALAVFTLVMVVAMWLIRVPLQMGMNTGGPAYTTVYQTTTRWNAFIALAIVAKLYGDPGLAILALAFGILVPILNVANILILAVYAGKSKPSARIILSALVKNPLIWGILIGLAIKLSGLNMPEPVMTSLDLLGRGALGMSLLALGAGLSWQAVRASGREVVLASFIRLLISPLVAFAAALAFGVGGQQLVIMVIAAAVPTAVNGYVLARAMGGDAELYAATSTAQVIVSFATLPVIIWLAMRFVA